MSNREVLDRVDQQIEDYLKECSPGLRETFSRDPEVNPLLKQMLLIKEDLCCAMAKKIDEEIMGTERR